MITVLDVRPLGALALAGLALASAGCRQAPAARAEQTARQVSASATSSDQARLWREAADKGLTVGLERVSIVEQPVQPRPRAKGTGQAASEQPQRVVIPPGVHTALRIVAAPSLGTVGTDDFEPASVITKVGDQIALNLGGNRTLTVLARVGDKPIPVSMGEKVQVRYIPRSDPRVPGDVLAIRKDNGDGIVQIVQGGTERVTVSVPAFGLMAKQSESAPPVAVDVSIGNSHQMMTPGQTKQVGGFTVTLTSSIALTGAIAGRIEGSPYSISLIAYRFR